MTILTINKKELEKRIGKITPELENTISMMGTPVEEITENEVSIEIFPNRPDLLSLENFSKAINQYIEKEGFNPVKINPPKKDYIVRIKKSVKKIRPYTVCAIVKGIKFNEDKINELIDVQEKLHNSIGRKRKKLAIGVYPLEKINLPITFRAEFPDNIKFQPLEFPKEITGKQILRQHPTGREYADLLKGFDKFPIFEDAKGEILSMPPIINSHKTGRITEKTKEIFIECSGSNLHYLNKALNILILTLSRMGGQIYAMNIIDKNEKNYTTPNFTPQKVEFKISDINKNLGLELNENQIKKHLKKMGINFLKQGQKTFALIPAYRTDILHWIDLVEEIAISYGYNKFQPIIPEISTIAQENPKSKKKKLIANILTGLGLLEVSSFHLTTKKNIKKIYFDFNEFIELENSKTEKDVLRKDLLTNHLQIFSENSNSAYPQKIFEMGKIFEYDKENKTETKILENEKLAISLTDEKITFTELKQILDYLFKMLNKKYTIENYEEHQGYIKGRCGIIKVNDKKVGFIGEVSPRALKNWKIKVPVVSLELDLEPLF